MKTTFFCLFLLAGSVAGQTLFPDQATARAALGLSAMRTLPRAAAGEKLHDLQGLTRQELAALRSFVAEQAPEQDRIMLRFQEDIAGRYGEPVISWELAYQLTSVLAGRELPDPVIARLTTSLVNAMDSAISCRKTLSSVRLSAKFRVSTESFYSELLAMGVDTDNAKIVTESLLRGGMSISYTDTAVPLVKPIPPARRRTN